MLPEADLSAAVVRSGPKYQAIVNALRRELALGRILAGEKLPTIPVLAARFGVGDKTIRKALAQLEATGVVAPDADGQLAFREPHPDQSLLREGLRTDPQGVIRFTEFRAVLEAGAASFAAARRSEADLAAMAEAQRQLAASSNRVESRNADTAFHLAVARAARNELLLEAIEDARMDVVGAVDLMRVDFIKDASYNGHEVIMRAIRAGKAQEAAEAMRLHIDTTREQFQRMLAAQL